MMHCRDCGHAMTAHGEYGCDATPYGEPCGCGETPAREDDDDPLPDDKLTEAGKAYKARLRANPPRVTMPGWMEGVDFDDDARSPAECGKPASEAQGEPCSDETMRIADALWLASCAHEEIQYQPLHETGKECIDYWTTIATAAMDCARRLAQGEPTLDEARVRAIVREEMRLVRVGEDLAPAHVAAGYSVSVGEPVEIKLSAAAPSPAPSASVPEWVPSAEELNNAYWAPTHLQEGSRWDFIRRLIASRAPRPSTVSVEEIARRIYAAHTQHDSAPLPWDDELFTHRPYWLALARAALSALPAPDAPKPASEACSKHGSELLRHGGCVRCDEEREAASEAQGEPTMDECERAFHGAQANHVGVVTDPMHTGRPILLAGIAAVRSICLARNPYADQVDALQHEQDKLCVLIGRGCQRHEIHARVEALLDTLSAAQESLPPGFEVDREHTLAECIERLASRAPSPSPALAAIVEAGDAMRECLACPPSHGIGLNIELSVLQHRERVHAYDRARAALPKEAK